MDPEVIRHLNDRGTVAGEGLRDLFSGVAEAASRAYVGMVDGWDDEDLDDANVPRPPATMRTVPPV